MQRRSNRGLLNIALLVMGTAMRRRSRFFSRLGLLGVVVPFLYNRRSSIKNGIMSIASRANSIKSNSSTSTSDSMGSGSTIHSNFSDTKDSTQKSA